MQVAYQAGVNEKLLGDFIRKHGVRDKVFSKSNGKQIWEIMKEQANPMVSCFQMRV